MREVIICKFCKAKDCRVDELYETEEITMEEYARRHAFPESAIQALYKTPRTARRFLITCQTCGGQHEFMERVEPLPQVFLAEEKRPGEFLSVRAIGTEERFKVGHIHAPSNHNGDKQ